MHAAIGDVVEPLVHALVEVFEARELGAADEATFQEPEEGLSAPLPVGIPYLAKERVEGVVLREVDEAWVPDRLTVGADAAEHDRRHRVEHDALGHTAQGLECTRKPLEQGRLT